MLFVQMCIFSVTACVQMSDGSLWAWKETEKEIHNESTLSHTTNTNIIKQFYF